MLSEQLGPGPGLLSLPLPSECTPQHRMLLPPLHAVLQGPAQPLYLSCKEKVCMFVYQDAQRVNECSFFTRSKMCPRKSIRTATRKLLRGYPPQPPPWLASALTPQLKVLLLHKKTTQWLFAVQYNMQSQFMHFQQCKTVAFQYLKGDYKRAGEKLRRAPSDRKKGEWF